MRRILCLLAGLVSLAVPALTRAADPPKFEFKDGDRVVLIGDTFIERDQKYGYLETLITLLNPDKTITFRNLGWSGDTVNGLARARFGPPAEGFQHLKDHVLALKPTVILVGYGMADSFDGEAGLPRFVSGLNTLLGVLAETKARVVWITPIPHENLGPPLPDPKTHNEVLALYSEAIEKVARERGQVCVRLFDRTRLKEHPIGGTDDGIHLTEAGYWYVAQEIVQALCGRNYLDGWHVDAQTNPAGRIEESRGVQFANVHPTADGVVIEATGKRLTYPPDPVVLRGYSGRRLHSVRWSRLLQVTRLKPGEYRLTIDGVKVASADVRTWAYGVKFDKGPEFDQVEKLRQTINEKNLLYFHRWRPQNETYLFGFRKNEQGNNAREIPLFDPLVAAKEQEIAVLKKPVKHTYELIRESEAGK